MRRATLLDLFIAALSLAMWMAFWFALAAGGPR